MCKIEKCKRWSKNRAREGGPDTRESNHKARKAKELSDNEEMSDNKQQKSWKVKQRITQPM